MKKRYIIAIALFLSYVVSQAFVGAEGVSSFRGSFNKYHMNVDRILDQP